MKQIRIVKALVVNEERLLLLKKISDEVSGHKGMWEAPGGKIEMDEDPKKGILREVLEETGQKGVLIKVLEPWTWEKEDMRGEVDVFLISISSKEVVLSGEHSKYKWILPRDMENMQNIIFKEKFIDYLREANLI
jgi:8-oxo-dGTP diphosphatase